MGRTVGRVKSVDGVTLNAANFRNDIIPNGTVNSSDVGQVKATSGNAVSAGSEGAADSCGLSLPVAGLFTKTAAPHGETLPITNRTLNFRLTVRDNRSGGGAINTDDMIVTVIENGAGFAVTAPSGGSVLSGANWNVTGTNLPPVNAANVKISLSTDGGYTYPHVLAASTPNDGSETVTLPSGVTSSTARVKVEAVNNIFFTTSSSPSRPRISRSIRAGKG